MEHGASSFSSFKLIRVFSCTKTFSFFFFVYKKDICFLVKNNICSSCIGIILFYVHELVFGTFLRDMPGGGW